MYHAAPLQASSQDALVAQFREKLGVEALHTLSDDAFNSALSLKRLTVEHFTIK